MSTEYEVFNFGPSRDIPYKGSTLFLQQHWGFITSDQKLVKLLRDFPMISIKQLKKKIENEYLRMNYMKLKQKAREMGLIFENNINKKELIKLMEGVK